jgi:hypothetical protein
MYKIRRLLPTLYIDGIKIGYKKMEFVLYQTKYDFAEISKPKISNNELFPGYIVLDDKEKIEFENADKVIRSEIYSTGKKQIIITEIAITTKYGK